MDKAHLAPAHFDFGRNWSAFADQISERAIKEAERGLARLIHPSELTGRRMLDIGCGSGLHSLAALRLGATAITAMDLDPASAATASRLLGRLAPDRAWTVEVRSVFDLRPPPWYDVVYSWGVLHHTGDMRRAIRSAAALVAPDGLFCIALYRRTPLCPAWAIEKRLYAASPRPIRSAIEHIYVLGLRLRLRGRFRSYVSDYASGRGMDFQTDVRDWLGGYPYESIAAQEVERLVGELGFASVRSFCRPPGLGVFGTGCDEFVFRRSG